MLHIYMKTYHIYHIYISIYVQYSRYNIFRVQSISIWSMKAIQELLGHVERALVFMSVR